MQVLETSVDYSEVSPIVVFRGEGGELITVRMAANAPTSEEDVITAAKAMLVQVATVSDASPLQKEQPDIDREAIYTLEYRDKHAVRSVPSVVLPNLEAVREEVMRSAVDLWGYALTRQEAPTGWAVRARDKVGNIVAVVDFEEARDQRAEDALRDS